MKAGFVIETGFSPTTGELLTTRMASGGHQYAGLASDSTFGTNTGGGYSTGTNRQTYVSLSGGFGEVRAGYMYTDLYELSTLAGYMFGSENHGSAIAHTWGNSWTGGTRANGWKYIAPKMGAVTLSVQGGAGTGRENATFDAANTADGYTYVRNKRLSFMGTYEQGPLKASLAHTTYEIGTSARADSDDHIGIFGAALPNATSRIANAGEESNKLTQLGASYDFGTAKVGATYNTGTRNILAMASTTGTLAKGSSVAVWDVKSYNVGVQVPFGKWSAFASSGKAEYSTGGSTAFDITQSQYGVRYNFSKRTVGYFISGQDKDTGTNIVAATSAAKREFTALGVMHSF